MKKPTPKEQLFCLYFSHLRNAVEAASRAGYKQPLKTGERLLRREDIRTEISRISKTNEITPDEITAGYRRLAFGSCCDALKLLLSGELPADGNFESVDLFNVSEIKKPKDGALEIKFFDRLKALEHLEALSGSLSGNDSALPFYEALLRSASTEKPSHEA